LLIEIFRFFSRILLLGLVVILSFLICFAPIIYTAAARPASGESPFQSAIVAVGHVLYRVFPFARGLFEDKVANFWCATSVVFRWKERFSSHSVLLVRAALGTTIVALLPSGINLFKQPTAASFILSLGTQALAFFLFSFQVHEKTILMPLAPLLLCYACGQRSMFFTAWLSNIAMFSMYPLLFRDGLVLPYCAFQIVFTLLAFRLARAPSEMWNVCCVISLSGCMVLHLASAFVPAPARYPDIHLLACAVYSFVHFALAFAGLHVLLYRLPQLNVVAEQVVSFSAAAVSDASASTSPAAVQPTPSRVLRSSTKKQQ
jgi:alpha-1,3-glucosyltransferase